MLRRYAPCLRLLLALALLTSACASSEGDGYDVADAVLESIGQPAGEPPAPAEDEVCTTRVVEDEYGFKNEIVTCRPAGPPGLVVDPGDGFDVSLAALSPGDLPLDFYEQLLALAPEAALDYFLPMSETLLDLADSCGSDFFAWRASLSQLADQVDVLTLAINEGQLEGYVGTPEARGFSRALMERALLQTDCDTPGGGEPFTEAELTADGTLELTSRAAKGLSELARLLDNASSGYLFHFFTTADNYEWLRTQQSNIDLIVYGTSQAGAGIDVPLLAQEMSTNAGNAFLYGSLAEVQQHWFPEVERYVDAETVVWLVGTIDLLIDCEPVGREQQFTERVERRNRTFASAGWFEQVDQVNLLLGPVGPENSNKGNGIKKTETDQAALDAHFLDYKDRFAAASFCSSRGETIATSAERMAKDGRNVVVIGMPLSPFGYEQLPGGVATASGAVEKLNDDYLSGLDVDLVDLTGVLQDRRDLWADYTHLTQSGAASFTQILADELKKLGL